LDETDDRFQRYLAVGARADEGPESTQCSHSRLVEIIDRLRPRTNGSSRPTTAARRDREERQVPFLSHPACVISVTADSRNYRRDAMQTPADLRSDLQFRAPDN
jgi:hypothetical protein